jgi:hypothetical protein
MAWAYTEERSLLTIVTPGCPVSHFSRVSPSRSGSKSTGCLFYRSTRMVPKASLLRKAKSSTPNTVGVTTSCTGAFFITRRTVEALMGKPVRQLTLAAGVLPISSPIAITCWFARSNLRPYGFNWFAACLAKIFLGQFSLHRRTSGNKAAASHVSHWWIGPVRFADKGCADVCWGHNKQGNSHHERQKWDTS